jgi:transcriptional regulator with XRE-family HTH domain
VINVVGELLSHAPYISSLPTPQLFFNNLTRIIEESACDSINLFSELVGMWSGKIRRLLSGQTKPSIDVLCHLCITLNLKPIDLLCKNEEKLPPENHAFMPYKDNTLPKLMTPWEEVEGNLRAVLEEIPPPSLEAVAHRLGYYPPRLKRHFSGLCAQISFRYKNHINNANQE